MNEDEELEPDEQPDNDSPPAVDPVRRSVLRGPGGKSEGALGLEMARLFGIDPRLLVHRPSPAEGRPTPPDEETSDAGTETAEDGPDGD